MSLTKEDLTAAMTAAMQITQPPAAPAKAGVVGIGSLIITATIAVVGIVSFIAAQSQQGAADKTDNGSRMTALETQIRSMDQAIRSNTEAVASLAVVVPTLNRIETDVSRLYSRDPLSRGDIEAMIAPVRQKSERNTERLDGRTDFMSETRSRLTRLESKGSAK